MLAQKLQGFFVSLPAHAGAQRGLESVPVAALVALKIGAIALIVLLLRVAQSEPPPLARGIQAFRSAFLQQVVYPCLMLLVFGEGD